MELQNYVVGELFPVPDLISQPGIGWHVDQHMVLVCQPNLGDPDALHADRVWFTHSGPLIGLVADVPGWGDFDTVGAWLEGHQLPDWVTQPYTDQTRIGLWWLWVEHTTGVLVRQTLTTLSPHASRQLRDRAIKAWQRPLSHAELGAAMNDWWGKYPDTRGVRRAAFVTSRLGQ